MSTPEQYEHEERWRLAGSILSWFVIFIGGGIQFARAGASWLALAGFMLVGWAFGCVIVDHYSEPKLKARAYRKWHESIR